MKNTKRKKSLEEELYGLGAVFLAISIVFVTLYFKIILPLFPQMSCVFNSILGIYCPGCGGTRAVSALLSGRVLLSIWYHPLVLYSAVIFGGFMLTHTLERLHVLKIKGWKFHGWYMYGAVTVLVLNFLIKNVLLMYFHITL